MGQTFSLLAYGNCRDGVLKPWFTSVHLKSQLKKKDPVLLIEIFLSVAGTIQECDNV